MRNGLTPSDISFFRVFPGPIRQTMAPTIGSYTRSELALRMGENPGDRHSANSAHRRIGRVVRGLDAGLTLITA